MMELHKRLMRKYSWYARWHKNPLHTYAHWFIFALFALVFHNGLYTNIQQYGEAFIYGSVTSNPVLAEDFVGPYASWKSVKDFGAKGDGVTDDTAAIQAAVNALRPVDTNNWSVLYFPAGTYKITSTIETTRSLHHDYLGAEVIGEDPLTTSIVWAGPSGGTMLHWDAWYDKVSRLTLDGKGIAASGMVRSGGFSTYSEVSDMIYKDITSVCLNLGAGLTNGIAEEHILRNRFYRCGDGIVTYNYNTLDIYVWYSYFEDNNYAIYDATGAFHSYENRFVRSKTADLKGGSNMDSSIVNNISLGSKQFIGQGEGNLHIEGNKIYNTSDIPIDLTYAHTSSLIDNLIVPPSNVPAILFDGVHHDLIGTKYVGENRSTMVGNTFATTDKWPVRSNPDTWMHGASFAGYGLTTVIENVKDGDPNTQSIGAMFSPINGWQLNEPIGTKATVTSYAMTSGALCCSQDSSNFDPQDWVLYGSNDWGATWIPLDTHTGEVFASRQQKRVFTVANPGAYSSYFLQINRTKGGSIANGSSFALAELELLNSSNQNLMIDPNALVMAGDEQWGQVFFDQQSIVSPATITIPTALLPWDFPVKRVAQIIEVPGFTDTAIQTAINQAAALPAGTNPVVHLPKGRYIINSSIVVPANVQMKIIGDGANEDGSVLNGNTNVPLLWLKGPSRVTLQDVSINNGYGTGDGILIDNANQSGGRVYGYEVNVAGNCAGCGQLLGAAYDINGLNQSHVNINASGFSNFAAGVRATGSTNVQFLTGASAGGSRMWDVRNGSNLIGTAYWYETDWPSTAALIDLPSTSSGNLAVATMHLAAHFYPIISAQSFSGTLTILSSSLDAVFQDAQANIIRYGGNGSASNILNASNLLPVAFNNAALTSSDTTSPTGNIAFVANLGFGGVVSEMTNKVSDSIPNNTFVENQLSLIRTMDTTPAASQPSGATDVKLLRVQVFNIASVPGITGIRITGTASNGTPTPTQAFTPTPIPTQTSTSTTPTPTPPTIQSDTTAPVVSLSGPPNGTILIKKSTVSLAANATDNIGVTKVIFYVNGTSTCIDTTSPFTCNWNVPKAPNKKYSVQAKGYDGSGNIGASNTLQYLTGR